MFEAKEKRIGCVLTATQKIEMVSGLPSKLGLQLEFAVWAVAAWDTGIYLFFLFMIFVAHF